MKSATVSTVCPSVCQEVVLEKAEEPEIKLPTSVGTLKKQESSRKASTSALLTVPKPLTVWKERKENYTDWRDRHLIKKHTKA